MAPDRASTFGCMSRWLAVARPQTAAATLGLGAEAEWITSDQSLARARRLPRWCPLAAYRCRPLPLPSCQTRSIVATRPTDVEWHPTQSAALWPHSPHTHMADEPLSTERRSPDIPGRRRARASRRSWHYPDHRVHSSTASAPHTLQRTNADVSTDNSHRSSGYENRDDRLTARSCKLRCFPCRVQSCLPYMFCTIQSYIASSVVSLRNRTFQARSRPNRLATWSP